ncbi:unnamed protein product [Penicillium salamii]|uniref:NmrA-like domain-containing protein n=1 Tax=Penicillium salamii TaxID=1612424 RepID=A0A9W4JFI8_9EURO|nr:unnamed protein product [Penicillium salamii]CAG8110328.1 unnamed protein product [Penicillium salamii]CAG8333131.1 unnamed protein product [Penicillium salamii]CAG8351093.1 unnamed protein product [Penicillium salamii]CAG8360530.1 unnamed protein product [Penicillium salamii]
MTVTAPLITVFGATGNQGGAVARSLAKNPSFRVRGLTRNPTSSASQTLDSQGVEVHKADAFDKDSMLSAFAGSWGVFVNINSDDKSIKEHGLTEFDMGKNIVDAAAEAGVRHFIFSSGPNSLEITGGKVKMNAAQGKLTTWFMFDFETNECLIAKYEIEQYARGIDRFETVSFICVAWFLENFAIKEIAPIFGGFPHMQDSDGYLTFVAPKWGGKEDVPFLSISEDLGDIVQGMFLDPGRWNGKVVHGCSDICSMDDVVSQFEQVTGRKSRFQSLDSWQAFNTHGVAELEDTKMMFGMTQESGGRYFGPEASEKQTASELKRNTALAMGLPKNQQELMTVESWFRKHSPSW